MSLILHPKQDALFLDIDGTLLDIAIAANAVVVPDGLIDNLTRLYEKLGGALALISGRCLEDIYSLFYPLRIPASGVHGAQWYMNEMKETAQHLPETLRENIREIFSSYPKLAVEDKDYAVAIHYRQAPELADTIEQILQNIISETAPYLFVMHGKMVIEIVYPDQHKGVAIERFMSHKPFIGRRPVFFGDDETDVFAINTCHKLGGIGVRIGHSEQSFGSTFSSPHKLRKWISKQV